MEVRSEKQVEYLFARFHHLIGFEKILNVQSAFPDITALRNEVLIKIELEYQLAGIINHYNKLSLSREDGGLIMIIRDLHILFIQIPQGKLFIIINTTQTAISRKNGITI